MTNTYDDARKVFKKTLRQKGSTCGAVAALARAAELATGLPEDSHLRNCVSRRIVACWAAAEGMNPLDLLQVRAVTPKLIWLTSAPMMVRTVGGGERGAMLSSLAFLLSPRSYAEQKKKVVPHWTDRDGEPLEYAVTHYRAMTPDELVAWGHGR